MRRPELVTTAKIAAAALAALLALSCATMALSQKASEEHVNSWVITRVLDARLADDELWLLLQLKRDRSNFSTKVALPIPAGEPVWAMDATHRIACPSALPWKRAQGISPPAWVLRDPSEFPAGGHEIPIRSLTFTDPSGLREAGIHGEPWAILLATFDPPPSERPPGGSYPPALVLVRESATGGESDKCILDTFIIDTTHHEGYAVLAPFALAADVITLPLQIFAVVYLLIVGE